MLLGFIYLRKIFNIFSLLVKFALFRAWIYFILVILNPSLLSPYRPSFLLTTPLFRHKSSLLRPIACPWTNSVTRGLETSTGAW